MPNIHITLMPSLKPYFSIQRDKATPSLRQWFSDQLHVSTPEGLSWFQIPKPHP